MTTREYLSQTFTLNRLLKAKESRIQDLHDMKEQIGRMSTGIKVKSSQAKDPMGDVIATLLDLISEYEDDCRRLISVQEEIAALINTVRREDYRLILFERYVNMKTWEGIAADNYYSEKHVYKLHSAAIKLVGMIPNDTPMYDKVSA